MDLIERYLGAVRWSLPAARADDIIAELADLIAARIEDREAALGRALTRDEVSRLLREFGHPLTVAGGYHSQRALIGPEVFPFYWFALRIMLVIVVPIQAIQLAGRIVTSSPPYLQALSQGAEGAIHSLLVSAALVTIAFAVIERTGWLAAYLEKWKPEELPDLSGLGTRYSRPARRRSGSRRSRSLWEPFVNLAFGIAFLGWWTGAIPISFIPQDADIAVLGAPVWAGLFWPVIALVSTRMLFGLVTLLRPAWKPLRAALILGCTAGTLAIASVLHAADRIVTVTGADAGKVATVQLALDKAFAVAVIVVAIVTVWQALVELWQLWRER